MNAKSSSSDRSTDLQYLLPEALRDRVVAVPRRSLNFSIVSFSLVAMAAGIALGGWIVSGQARSWLIGALVLGSLALAAVIRKHEARLLHRILRLQERAENQSDQTPS